MNAKTLFFGGTFAAMLACSTLVAPRAAHAQDAITFTPGNPWAQAIGSISKSDHSHEYTVHATGGKTFKINLVSRDPNLYFSVKSPDSRKPLIDTETTGDTTWSVQPAADTDYTVRVYAEPDQIASGDVSKFALQVGIF